MICMRRRIGRSSRWLSAVMSRPSKRTLPAVGSIPRLSNLDEKIRPIEGTVPELIDLPAQCRFRDRCGQAVAACSAEIPMRSFAGGRQARCVVASLGPGVPR